MHKRYIWRHGHPLANKHGKVRKSRHVLYEKLNGVAGSCHWCSIPLTWQTLCADHLDSNIMNDVSDNLVGSCRGCNANRDDGTGYGRIKPKDCEYCGQSFLSKTHNKRARFCSVRCATTATAKRGTTASHGTRSRYNYGCRCDSCKTENSVRWQEWYYRSNTQYAHK